MMILLRMLVLANLIFAAPAVAQWPGREAGGWRVNYLSESCAFSDTFDDPGATLMLVHYRHEGQIRVALWNSNWSIAEHALFEVEMVIGEQAFSGRAVGLRADSDGKRGFLTPYTRTNDFLDVIGAGHTVEFYRVDGGNRTLITRLNLAGSRAAVAAVRSCHAAGLRTLAAAEAYRRRFQDQTRDPFTDLATQSASGIPNPSLPDTPAVKEGGSLNDADYPASAIRAEAHGNTHFTLSIGPDGRVTGCTVTGSSGNSALDTATCSIAQRRFRYRPATRGGQPIASTVSETAYWRVPR